MLNVKQGSSIPHPPCTMKKVGISWTVESHSNNFLIALTCVRLLNLLLMKELSSRVLVSPLNILKLLLTHSHLLPLPSKVGRGDVFTPAICFLFVNRISQKSCGCIWMTFGAQVGCVTRPKCFDFGEDPDPATRIF